MSVYTGQKTCNALYKPQYNTYKQIFLHRHIFKSDLCLFYSCMYVTFNIRAVWLSVPQSSKYQALHTICISPVVLRFTKGQVPDTPSPIWEHNDPSGRVPTFWLPVGAHVLGCFCTPHFLLWELRHVEQILWHKGVCILSARNVREYTCTGMSEG